MRTLWDDTPEAARRLLPEHICEHLKRARYGKSVWVRLPGWIDFRTVRKAFHGLLAAGARRAQAVEIVATEFRISERWVWHIVRTERM
jgi:DNA-binding GntR family transcriptional regulator